MKATRREPEGGYAEGAKQKYGREKWAAVEACCKNGIPVHRRVVLYLETRHGHETDRLLRRGYKPQNLHAVNWVPAELAVLNARLKKERGITVVSHGVELTRAIRDTAGLIDIYDCDLTTTADRATSVMHLIAQLGKPSRVVTATVQCGREGEGWLRRTIKAMGREGVKRLSVIGKSASDNTEHLTQLTANDMQRLGFLTSSAAQANNDFDAKCTSHIVKWRNGKYVSSSGHGMLWAVMKLVPHNDEDIREINELAEDTGLALASALHIAAHGLIAPWCALRVCVDSGGMTHFPFANAFQQALLSGSLPDHQAREMLQDYYKKKVAA